MENLETIDKKDSIEQIRKDISELKDRVNEIYKILKYETNYFEDYTLDLICLVCAEIWDVSIVNIKGKGKSSKYIHPRWAAIWLSDRKTGNSKTNIGKFFNRDHTTIIHACSKVDILMSTNKLFSYKISEAQKVLLDKLETNKEPSEETLAELENNSENKDDLEPERKFLNGCTLEFGKQFTPTTKSLIIEIAGIIWNAGDEGSSSRQLTIDLNLTKEKRTRALGHLRRAGAIRSRRISSGDFDNIWIAEEGSIIHVGTVICVSTTFKKEENPNEKWRKCLTCQESFISEWFGNRMCYKCRKNPLRKSAGPW